jgi:integrase
MAERKDKKGRILKKSEYQNKDGRYFLIYENEQGKECRAYSWALTPKDKEDLIRKGIKCEYSIREIKKQIIDTKVKALTHSKKKWKLDELFEESIRSRGSLRKSTKDNYRYMYAKFIKPEFGFMYAYKITEEEIYSFYCKLIDDKKFLPRTIENLHTILSPVFDMAIEKKQIIVNPCNMVLPKLRRHYKNYWDFYKDDKNALTVEEQVSLMAFVRTQTPEYYNLLMVFLGTGCRVSEIIGLTWNDIDFDNGIIHINHQIHYGKGEKGNFEKTITPPKTRSSIRNIKMMDCVKTALQDEKAKGKKCNEVIKGYIIKNKKRIDVALSDFVFVNRFGDVQLPHNINRLLERIRLQHNAYEQEQAQKENRQPIIVRHFSAHILRHTYTTRACEVDGVNISVISKMLGHADITTTLNIYNDVQESLERKAISDLENKMIIG